MDIIKISLIGIAGMLLVIMLRRERPEIAVIISLAVCIYIFTSLLGNVSGVIEFAERLAELVPIDSGYFLIVVKMIGITYAAEFASDVCSDFGCTLIARQIELFARISIIAVSVPVLSLFIEAIDGFV